MHAWVLGFQEGVLWIICYSNQLILHILCVKMSIMVILLKCDELSEISFLGLRDWLEDELRAFEGGSDGLLPCVWDHELSSFPQVTNYLAI